MKQIKTLNGLMKAAKNKRAVIIPGLYSYGKKPSPAAWIINHPGDRILYYLNIGMFLYPNKHRARKYE